MPIRVAIVEDHAPTREALVRLLDSHPGFRCVGAHATASEAVRRIPDQHPDVALVDIVLPRQSGIECVRQLRELLPDLSILMLTVHDDAERLFASLSAGACGYLLKSTHPAEILAAIREVVAGGAPMSRTIARKVLQHFQKLPAPPVPPEMERLTGRESEILHSLATGYTDKEIAAAVGISSETVRVHLRHIYEKLHVTTRTAAVAKYLGHPPPPPPR
jgi:DNA-binding NarL/FixJ family response regulator